MMLGCHIRPITHLETGKWVKTHPQAMGKDVLGTFMPHPGVIPGPGGLIEYSASDDAVVAELLEAAAVDGERLEAVAAVGSTAGHVSVAVAVGIHKTPVFLHCSSVQKSSHPLCGLNASPAATALRCTGQLSSQTKQNVTNSCPKIDGL